MLVKNEPKLPAGKLRSVITYLEMTAPPWADGPPPSMTSRHPDISIELLARVSVDHYRDLYRRVGEPWLWWEQLLIADDVLAAKLRDPAVDVRVFHDGGGDLVGYSELDRRQADSVEIVFFGLVPAAIGRGLGRHLLGVILAAAWQDRPRRVWLHTCSEDHPKALAFYQAAGFRPYRQERVVIDDPRTTGLLPVHVAPHVPLSLANNISDRC
ncbi:MAG: GNAT family N-acetyltransferase [Rhodospirillales bacterium]|nr:GNAT family N-acetyltransferase [Rhodospirillales bacterium]